MLRDFESARIRSSRVCSSEKLFIKQAVMIGDTSAKGFVTLMMSRHGSFSGVRLMRFFVLLGPGNFVFLLSCV